MAAMLTLLLTQSDDKTDIDAYRPIRISRSARTDHFLLIFQGLGFKSRGTFVALLHFFSLFSGYVWAKK